ncbi:MULTISPECIES: type II secretion system minor pseudopilin GspK [Pseudomonas]|uniref:type II secretion system minor pseudopilin GspK n=1 Tax=Pseudomonas TaxID=286 RepID=UPI00064262F5|nr:MULTISPECIES: type II secretion system minor pseudopilin GspK [Pseudomonas]MCO7574332.1 type II secretion system minor pseudopilin GspK [Pseudomonas chlororaphis]MCO7592580.1 type II secretion system minor pseudopilin GspK [Pseudomonas chlororaphis]MDP9530810.1 type II secretion system minor pseudopilin GspK [Pseudomonas protegens]RBJ77575.1 general secretion pathway protein GspK [Pseudomonas sp. MWU12-2534b]
MNSHSPSAAKQRGMAIISALLIAAVVAVIAAGMLSRQTVLTRAVEAEQARIVGSGVLQGGLEYSRQLLWEARQREVLTRLDQPWARPIDDPVPGASGGRFQGRLQDLQGKFNLRNLVFDQQVDPEQVQSFQQLCQLLGVDPALSRRISQRVIASYPQRVPGTAAAGGTPGTFNSGRLTSPGALAQTLPPRQPMLRGLDDLRGLPGVDDALLARLEPYVGILPGNTWINGNTASAEVLAAAVPGLSLAQARALVAERDAGHWFINRGDFVNRLHLPFAAQERIKVGITSEWFLLQGQVRREQRQITLQALLHRPEDRMPQVIWSRVGA